MSASRYDRLKLRVGAAFRAYRRRGHGVHSPFVYTLTTKVFRKRSVENSDTYEMLLGSGVPKADAVRLQNLVDHCRGEYEIKFILPDQPIEVEKRNKMIVCIVGHNNSGKRRGECARIIASHPGTTIEKLGFVIIVFNDDLPKQHFKL